MKIRLLSQHDKCNLEWMYLIFTMNRLDFGINCDVGIVEGAGVVSFEFEVSMLILVLVVVNAIVVGLSKNEKDWCIFEL